MLLHQQISQVIQGIKEIMDLLVPFLHLLTVAC